MFHPAIVPSSVANRNTAAEPVGSVNAPVLRKPLYTCPVGLERTPGLPEGIVTGGNRSTRMPELAITSMLVRPLPASEIQNSPPVPREPYEMPQGLIRFGSVLSAGTDPSEIKLVCLKEVVIKVGG